MAYFTSLLIIALVLYLVVTPFFSKNKKWNPDDIKDDLDEATKEQLYATLNELEMEYNMGKLPKKEYVRMKKYYELAVTQKIKEESELEVAAEDIEVSRSFDDDSVSLEQDIEREIEKELAQLRQQRKGN